MAVKKPKSVPSDTRLVRGYAREEARFTALPTPVNLPDSDGATLKQMKRYLQQPHVRPVLAANTAVISASWHTGQIIVQRQREQGWGAEVIDRLSSNLRHVFPGMGSLSAHNLLSMQLLAQTCPAGATAKQPVSQLRWGRIVGLLQMVKESATRRPRRTASLTWVS